MLTPAQIATLGRLVNDALALPPGTRQAWIDALDASHAALGPALRRVLERIAADDDAASIAAGGPASGPAPQGALHTLPRLPAAPPEAGRGARADERIGPWRLERRLGAGGMGEVWLAARADGAFDRLVALKLPHAARLTEAMRQRFARERDILATLSHPHIAQFLDAGVADGERPWIALELVEGTPITAHADAHALSIDARLALLQQVLGAVGHAHRRLVAHRDLKPSNILVTEDGQVKLLDFGIAKLLEPDGAAASGETTRDGGGALTPDYAAPEQLAGAPVTTAVDVYALGVVAFELLAGQPPFDRGRRALRVGTEAPLASRRVPDRVTGEPVAAARRRALRGDLDAVLAKALEAEPKARYETVEAFADDLGRVRRGEPVKARRASRVERAAKFLRRHPVESALGAALALSLAAGVGAIAWEADRARLAAANADSEAARARSESARAESEARRAAATRDFLVGVFKSSDPRTASDQPRGAITARQLLDLGARRIDSRFADDPDTRIQLLGIVADIYAELEEGKAFHSLWQRQTELATARYGALHPVTLDCGLRGVDEAINEGDFAGAKAALARLDGQIARAGRDASPERAYWWLLQSWATMNDPASAPARRAALDRARALYERVAPGDPHLVFVLGALGNLAHAAGDEVGAADLTRRSIALAERASERDDGALAVNYTNLGKTLAYIGDFDGADRAHARAMQLAEGTYGREAWPYWIAAVNRAQALHLRGARVAADAMFDALAPLVPPPAHAFRNALEENAAARVRETWGQRLAAEGRPEAALPLYEAARTGFARAPTYEWDLRQLAAETGAAQADAGRLAPALRTLRAAVDEYAAKSPAGDPGALRAREALARTLWRAGRAADAEALWLRVIADAGGRPLPAAVLADEGLARRALAAHDAATALHWLDLAQQRRDAGPARHDVRLGATLDLTRAEALQAGGHAAEALGLARDALEVRRRTDAPGSRALKEAQSVASALSAARPTP